MCGPHSSSCDYVKACLAKPTKYPDHGRCPSKARAVPKLFISSTLTSLLKCVSPKVARTSDEETIRGRMLLTDWATIFVSLRFVMMFSQVRKRARPASA